MCQNCKNDFVVTSTDFDFYGKMNVPAPTFCPDCRLQRRLSFRNERSLYKRPCDMCGVSTISMYDPEAGITSYCGECWWSDKWDATTYGKEYDFSKSFFSQLAELIKKVPYQHLAVSYKTLENSSFTNMNHALKNCYYLFNSDYNESCMYGEEVERSRDSVDVTMIEGTQMGYESLNCNKCYEIYYSVDCESSHNTWFSKNLSGCSSCFGCINLRNQSYCIFNEQFSKDEYAEKIKEFNLGSHSFVADMKKQVRDFWLQFPHKYMHGLQNLNSTGDYIYNSKFSDNSFIVNESEYCKYCMWLIIKGNKECYDFTQFGENTERVYESLTCGKNISDIIGCVNSIEARALRYCLYLFNNNNNCFGCVGLRGKQYCILNKQYSKEEYDELIPKIIEQMKMMPYIDSKERGYSYGDFMPIEISQFAYNETSAQEFFPITKDFAEGNGFPWKNRKIKNYEITHSPEELPDDILEIDDDIVSAIIGCAHKGECNDQCATAFRVTAQELQFYRAHSLPLPRLCPNCRHYMRVVDRNPNKLWHRACMCENSHPHHEGKCLNQFETAYSPDRAELVYCEACYQAEVI